MADFLLEILSEEMPARMQLDAIVQLQNKLEQGLQEARLSYGEITVFSTPRRLAIRIQQLPEEQPDNVIERKGPKEGAPEAAIEGFCQSAGVTRDQLELRDTDKGCVYFATSTQRGKPVKEALPDIIEPVLEGFHWPKSMRWGSTDGQWVRPMTSLLCLLDEDIVPLTWHHLTAGNITAGHRFMSDDNKVVIPHPREYASLLEQHYVIADREQRLSMITQQMHTLAQQKQLEVKVDAGLLEEVAGLVEYPVAVLGNFDTSFLSLPPEVLVLEMRHHQKYFALTDAKGTLAPHFITIANIAASDDGALIRAGNERVLRARLADGAFYYNQDKKKTLDAWNADLNVLIFHEKLGSVADKVERIKASAGFLAVFVPHAHITNVMRAAELCKADLPTGMVGEFPELQGVMGRYYALVQGENPAVANAIKEHYQPVGANDDVPSEPAAIAVALADKLDSLAALFAVGEAPTGSKDPFALRRSALGVLRIIREHSLRIPLGTAIGKAIAPFNKDDNELKEQIIAFMLDRLKVSLKESLPYDVVDAVCANRDDDVVRLIARAHAVHAFLQTDDGSNILAASKRASNILRKEEQKDNVVFESDYKRSLSELPQEQALIDRLRHVRPVVEKHLKAEQYHAAMTELATLRAPLDSFFEDVIVNTDNPKIRLNRLKVLASLRELLESVADLSKIAG